MADYPEQASAHAIRIDGIGPSSFSTSDSDGTLWGVPDLAAGDSFSSSLNGNTRSHQRAIFLIRESLKGLNTSVDRHRAKTKWSGFNFEIVAADRTAELFLTKQARATGEFATTASDTDGSITLDNTTLEGKVIYTGAETISLDTHNGAGQYSVTRGIYGSTAHRHEAGDNFFLEVPFWESRGVTLYDARYRGPDAGWTLIERGQFRVDDEITQEQGDIVIPCNEGGAGLDRAKIGRADRGPERLTGGLIKQRGPDSAEDQRGFATSGNFVYTPQIRKEAPSSEGETAFQVHGQIVPGKVESDQGSAPFTPKATTANFESEALFNGRWSEDEFDGFGSAIIDDKRVHEVFMIDRANEHTPLAPLQTINFSEKYGYHILAIYACFHLSTPGLAEDAANFDLFRPDWSLLAKRWFEDGIVTTIKDLIDTHPEDQVDEWVIGAKGESVEIRRELLGKLRAFGYFEGLTNAGYLTVSKSQNPTIQDYEDGKTNQIRTNRDEQIIFSTGGASTIDTVEADINTDVPQRDGLTVEIEADAASPDRPGAQNASSGLTLDFGAISRDRQKWATEKAIAKVLTTFYDTPVLHVDVPDHHRLGLDYRLGKSVVLKPLGLSDEWLVDKSGGRIKIDPSDDEQFTGFILGRKYNPGDRSYRLQIEFAAAVLTRWRAPSGVIAAWDSGTNTMTFGSRDGSSGDTAYGDTQKDAGRFTAGDEVEIFNQDYTKWTHSQIRTVDSVDTSGSSNDVTLDGGFGGNDPSTEARRVKLAGLDTDSSGTGYKNDGLDGQFSEVNRAYAFLADIDLTLGDADINADEYGG